MAVGWTLVFLLHMCAMCMGAFRKDYQYNGEVQGWFKLHRLAADWPTARLQCYSEGANLASPLDADMMSAIRSIIDPDWLQLGSVHSGVHAMFSDGVFTSVEGVPIDDLYMKWNENEPAHDTTKQCTAYAGSGIMLSDCNSVLPYICFRNSTAADVLTDCGTVDKAYSLHESTGHCYKYHPEAETWPRAQRICQAEGGYLAIIDHDKEEAILVDLFVKGPKPFYASVHALESVSLGFRLWGQDDDWWTVHGQQLSETGFTDWAPDEPNSVPNAKNDYSKQYCGTMYKSGKLDDNYCDINIAYICEKTVDSLL